MSTPRNVTIRKAESAVSTALSVAAVYRQAREAFDTVKARNEYTVSVLSTDPLFHPTINAAIAAVDDGERRDVTVSFHRPPAWSGGRGHAVASPSGLARRDIVVAGHPISFSIRDVELKSLPRHNESPDEPDVPQTSYGLLPRVAKFTARTAAGRDALVAWMDEHAAELHRQLNPPRMHVMTRWGGWDSIGVVAGRPARTVTLGDGQLDRIINDMATFLSSRDDYDRIGIPWHRGYLFEGPPGGGKSSVARVLASHFNIDLWYMPLSDVGSDTNILSLISQIRGGIVLLEDVDVFTSSVSRDSDGDSVTLSGVLNALDGVATPPGLLTIMATNEPDRLDPALVRPGRVDVREHFGPIGSMAQATAILENAYGSPLPDGLSDSVVGMMPSTLVGAIKEHLRDPASAIEKINALGFAANRF